MAAADEQTIVDALYRISSLVNATDDPREALELIIDEIMRVLPCSSASIELLNPDRDILEIEVFRGLPEHAKGLQLRLGQGVTGWVALHGKPLLVPDVTQDPRYVPVAPEIRCEMAVPMKGDTEAVLGAIVGVVNIDSTTPHAFDEHHLKLLTLLTNEAARVVSKLWFIRRLNAKAQQLQSLLNAGRSLVKQREIGEILESLTTETRNILNSRVSALFLFDQRREVLELKAIAGLPPGETYREQVALRDSSIGTVAKRRKQVEIYDLRRTEEHHFVPLIQQLDLVSMLACPIRYEDEVIGTLHIYTSHPHRFSNDERRLLETLASLGAIAIQNSRLYARIFQGEETLRRSERLTTLGLLSAEIAHEIRNPLTVLRLLFESLDLQFPPGDPREKDREIIGEKLDQLEGIVNRVLQFGKSREDLRARYNLRQIIDDTILLVRLKLQQSRIILETQYPDAEGLLVEVSKGQIQQVILNLIINATQAMPEGGRILISAEPEERGDQRVACVTLRDSGQGVPADLRDKIFDSFLSGHAEGTGLGLSIVKRILVSHSGDIELAQTGPEGTTLRFWLPRLDERPALY